jgi:hypothetical protein
MFRRTKTFEKGRLRPGNMPTAMVSPSNHGKLCLSFWIPWAVRSISSSACLSLICAKERTKEYLEFYSTWPGLGFTLFHHIDLRMGFAIPETTISAQCGLTTITFNRSDHCELNTPPELRAPLDRWLEALVETFSGKCESVGVPLLNQDGNSLGWRRVGLPTCGSDVREHRHGYMLPWDRFVEELREVECLCLSPSSPRLR